MAFIFAAFFLNVITHAALCQGPVLPQPIPVKVIQASKESPFPLLAAMGTINPVTKVDLGSEIPGKLRRGSMSNKARSSRY